MTRLPRSMTADDREPTPGDDLRRRFGWHPEPDLIAVGRTPDSRAALEALGAEAWATALDYVFDHGIARGMGEPADAAALRELLFGPTGRPAAAPHDPTPSAALLDEFRERLAPHQLNAWHPRVLSYFTPPPLVLSIVGELLTQWTNQGIDIWHAGPVGALVEEEVVRWLCDLIGFGPSSFGLLTSGGVMANFIGMALARDIHLRELLGLEELPRGGQLAARRVYTSDQSHFSIARALDLLGFPHDTLVVLPSDGAFRLAPDGVAAAIARDREAGLTPFAIAAVCGSTNTGSVDDVPGLAALAEREGLWLHVDAAYGGAVRLSEREAWRAPGLERAHSVTIDPHKWFFQPYDVGAITVRDGRWLEEAFGRRRPEYYRGGRPAPEARDDDDRGAIDFYTLGFEGSRRWRALKLWLSWKHLGTSGLGRLVEMNVDVARHLARRVAESDDFEACPPEPDLSVVCFRHLPPGLDGATLDAHQDRLAAALEASGDGWLSTTSLRGWTWLRAGVVNYLATEEDIDRLLETLRRLAAAL